MIINVQISIIISYSSRAAPRSSQVLVTSNLPTGPHRGTAKGNSQITELYVSTITLMAVIGQRVGKERGDWVLWFM